MREFVFKIQQDGIEILNLLTHELHCSANIISKMKQGEYILVNGKRENVRCRLKSGDELKVIIPSAGAGQIEQNPEIKFGILYEDEDILIAEKPADLPTHPSMHHFTDTLANGVVAYLNDSSFTFRAVNRLDRETSGVVLIAKNMLSAHLLSLAVKERRIKKIYRAITCGVPKECSGVIKAPIAREIESIITRCVREDGQYAETHYKLLKEKSRLALLEVEPITGRTHQIRVHFAHIGCPLLGDGLYGERIEGERTRLHCYKMEFIHPITGEFISAVSDLPKDFDIF